jgi:Fe-S cluster biogenesis protein NfuA/nitrite reductase/ring-hydroxylating ferredoxin subunit
MAAEAPDRAHDPEALMARVQELEDALERVADPATAALVDELLATFVELYGEGLRRIVAALQGAGTVGEEVSAALAQDGVVASLLLVHDLYPVGLEERVREALETVRPYMESHGGDVELLGIEDGVARLRLQGSCHGCRASSATLELAIKQALDEHAPDLAGFVAEGAVDVAPAGSSLPMAGNGEGPGFELPLVPPGGSPAWVSVEGVEGLPEGGLTAIEVAGEPILVTCVEGALLAYAGPCPGCGAALAGGRLEGPVLRCESCARRFDLPRAGREVEGDLQLRPVPLLRDDGRVRVAVAG